MRTGRGRPRRQDVVTSCEFSQHGGVDALFLHPSAIEPNNSPVILESPASMQVHTRTNDAIARIILDALGLDTNALNRIPDDGGARH